MLQFLPYALAAYGGVRGYRSAKKEGRSGLSSLLRGAAGAAIGYYGGKGALSAGSALNIPGFTAAQTQFTPFLQTAAGQGLQTLPFFPGQTAQVTTGVNPEFLGTDKAVMGGSFDSLVKNPNFREGVVDDRNFLQKLLMREKRNKAGEILKTARGTTAYEIDPFKAGSALAIGSYASGAFEQEPQDVFMPTYNVDYATLAAQRGPFKFIDPATGTEKNYEEIFIPEANRPEDERTFGPYAIAQDRFNEGGLAQIRKFNEGGINYLPSKTSHDENDVNNYVRASGYVEDGSGVGDKDEDTMLAQLADGEFVTRADGVLGAGIIAGANPNSMRDMREKGAQYFYEQQRRYKRVFDLLKDSNGTSKTN